MINSYYKTHHNTINKVVFQNIKKIIFSIYFFIYKILHIYYYLYIYIVTLERYGMYNYIYNCLIYVFIIKILICIFDNKIKSSDELSDNPLLKSAINFFISTATSITMQFFFNVQ